MEPSLSTAFDGPQYFDILSAQRGYGDFNEKSFGQLGNDDSTRATDLGSIADGGTVEVGQDANSLVVDFAADDFVSIDDESDTDFYKFTVTENGTIDINLEALGFTFRVGGQTGNPPEGPFDTTVRSNLGFELLDSNLTSLGLVDANGLGGAETLTGVSVTADDYFIRVFGADNADENAFDVQFYGLTAAFTSSAVPEPTSAVLLSAFVGTMLFRRRRS